MSIDSRQPCLERKEKKEKKEKAEQTTKRKRKRKERQKDSGPGSKTTNLGSPFIVHCSSFTSPHLFLLISPLMSLCCLSSPVFLYSYSLNSFTLYITLSSHFLYLRLATPILLLLSVLCLHIYLPISRYTRSTLLPAFGNTRLT